jgi:hypothetical protein
MEVSYLQLNQLRAQGFKFDLYKRRIKSGAGLKHFLRDFISIFSERPNKRKVTDEHIIDNEGDTA